MRRREFLMGATALAWLTTQAEALGIGKLGAGLGRLGATGKSQGGGSSSSLLLDEQFIPGTYFPGPLASDLVDSRTGYQYLINASNVVSKITSGLSNNNVGLLNEAAIASNFFKQNGAMTVAPWGANQATITDNFGVAPDGTTTASRFNNTANVFGSLTQTMVIPAGNYTMLVWVCTNGVQAVSNSTRWTMVQGNPNVNAGILFASSSWQLFAFPFTSTGASTYYGWQGDGSVADLLFWRPMIIAGTFPNLAPSVGQTIPYNLPSIAETLTTQAGRNANAATIQHTGIASVRFTFDDNSIQTISGISTGSQYQLTTALNRPLIKRLQGWSGAAPAITPVTTEMAVANRGCLPWKNSGSNGSTGFEHISYSQHHFGVSCTSYRPSYTGMMDGGAGEVADQSCTIEAGIYFPTAPGATKTVKFLWGGNPIGNLTAGVAEYLPDAVLPATFGWEVFPQGAQFFLTTQRKFTTAQTVFSYNVNSKGVGSGTYAGSGSGSFLDGAKIITTTSNFVDYTTAMGVGILGGAQSQFLYLPMAHIGTPTTASIAVHAIGDSLMESMNNYQGSTGGGEGGYGNFGGWFARGMTGVVDPTFSALTPPGVNGRIIPWSNTAVQGASTAGCLSVFSARAALMKYFTHVLCNFGHNGDNTTANEIVRLQTLWALCKSTAGSRVRHVEQVLLLPLASTSDGYLAYANETITQPFTTYRDAINPLITSNVGSNGLDATYSHNNLLEGQADKWTIGGSTYLYVNTDTIHPNPAGHDLITPQFLTRAASWS